ncbi:MAG: iron-containing alcohol dehydrogenase [Pseudomonadota bacterium]
MTDQQTGNIAVPMGRFDYIDQKSVLFGQPMAQAVAGFCAERGEARVLVVAARSLSKNTDAITILTDALGQTALGVFDEVEAHAPIPSALVLAEQVRDAKPDRIVVVGGGSAIDTTKAALVAVMRDAKTIDEVVAQAERGRAARGDTSAHPVPPCRTLTVPTTLSGAEFGVIGGTVDPRSKIKEMMRAPWLCAEAVVYDPGLSLHTLEWLWLSTGIRAVDHAVETVLSPDTNAYTDSLALAGLYRLGKGLRGVKADPSDLAARLDCQFGVWLASVGIGRVRYGASHGIGHQLGAVGDVPHGHTSCVLLPAVMRFNASVIGDRFPSLAHALGRSDNDAPRAVADLISELGQPTTLGDVGIEDSQFGEIAETSMQNPFVQANPRPITVPEDIMRILWDAA